MHASVLWHQEVVIMFGTKKSRVHIPKPSQRVVVPVAAAAVVTAGVAAAAVARRRGVRLRRRGG
jgi:hypothetical protein